MRTFTTTSISLSTTLFSTPSVQISSRFISRTVAIVRMPFSSNRLRFRLLGLPSTRTAYDESVDFGILLTETTARIGVNVRASGECGRRPRRFPGLRGR
jgi:hypothetical protein